MRVNEALLRQQLLTSLAPVQLTFPLCDDSLHLLNFCDKQSHIIALFKRQTLQLASTILYLLLESLHLLSESHSKPVKNFFVNLIVLVVDFALHSAITNFKATEVLEVLRSVKGLSTLPDLIEQLVPPVNVFAQQIVNRRILNVPEGLVRLPRLVISLRIAKDLFELGVD